MTDKSTVRNMRNDGIKIVAVKGDITKEDTDAIVNAAHEGLSGGGGVDGAIHRAGGKKLTGECMHCLYGCPTGEARITFGYNLPCKYVIHTVGPIWRGGEHGESLLLSNCYRYCLMFAEMQGLKSISLPCISTGAYNYPNQEAAEIAVDEIKKFFDKKNRYLKTVRFVCFLDSDYDIYTNLLEQINDDLNNDTVDAVGEEDE